MIDTSPLVEERLRALYGERTPAQRLRMATAMFSVAKRLALAGLAFEDAGRGAVAIRRALLERLHGDDLSPEQLAAVAAVRLAVREPDSGQRTIQDST